LYMKEAPGSVGGVHLQLDRGLRME
jgi:hypothetical protein